MRPALERSAFRIAFYTRDNYFLNQQEVHKQNSCLKTEKMIAESSVTAKEKHDLYGWPSFLCSESLLC